MRRHFNLAGAYAIALSVVVFGGWIVAAASEQRQQDPKALSTKTASGAPSLDGLWSNAAPIPLERDPKYGTRELFTEEELAAMAKGGASPRPRREPPKREVGSEQHVQGGYHDLAPPPAPGSGGPRRIGRYTSLVIDPPDGRIPPYTPEKERQGKIQREFEVMLLQATSACKTKQPECDGGTYGPVSPRYYDVPPYYVAQSYFAGGLNRALGPEDMDLRTRCLLPPLPNWSGTRRIVQSKNSIAITYESGQGQNWVRVIPITDRPHAPAHMRFWGGDSRARWEGDTLVVDVTNFDPRSIYPDDGGYAGRIGGARENLHLVEKFKRIDADTLQYIVTIEDPTTWTKPWTIRQEFRRQDERASQLYYEPRCHEGNFGLPGIMSGAREMDKAFKEGKRPDPATLCIAQCGGDRDNFPQ